MSTVKDIYNRGVEKLKQLYVEQEAKNIVCQLMLHLLSWPKTTWLLEQEKELSFSQKKNIENNIGRLVSGEPLQYVVGEVTFRDCMLKVSPDTLIPRPETEWMCKLMVEEIKGGKHKNILDIGTGSGCIAIALKKELPHINMYATDISVAALKMAEENANLNQVDICFKQQDILTEQTVFPHVSFDLVVSNPPYIPLKEIGSMHPNVKKHEPHQALFVKNETPFIFYEKIIGFIQNSYGRGTHFMFEIHAGFSEQIICLLQSLGCNNVVRIKDPFDKWRYLCGEVG